MGTGFTKCGYSNTRRLHLLCTERKSTEGTVVVRKNVLRYKILSVFVAVEDRFLQNYIESPTRSMLIIQYSSNTLRNNMIKKLINLGANSVQEEVAS